ncbi:MAG: glycosyltransferase [Lachnospiraceae bacterium]|nr:glycosyltransferase [Lachnospiraceae bacterium]
MKILTLVSEYPSYENEIPNIFVHKILKGLKRRGENVYVLLLDFRSFRKKRPWGFSSYEYDGIKVYRYALPVGPIYILLEYLMHFSIRRLYEYAYLKEGKPDVIHAHFGTMGYVATALNSRYSIPYIVTEHSSSLLNIDKISTQRNKFYYKGYASAQKVIAVSNVLKGKIHEKMPQLGVNVIPNVLGKEFCFSKVKKNSHFTIITVGRLVESKRFDLLISAISELYKEGEMIKLWIVGDGELRDQLQLLAKQLDICNLVEFWGNKNVVELNELYNKSHLFVLPSEFETFGVVYIEANACGLPIIATDCGGPADIVNKSNGILIPKNNLTALKNAIISIKTQYSDYSAENISRNTIEMYGENLICEEYIKIYRGVVREYEH